MTDLGSLPQRVVADFDEAAVDRLVRLRREIHRDPELAFVETRTAQRLHDALASIPGAVVHRVAGTGVVAPVPGGGGVGEARGRRRPWPPAAPRAPARRPASRGAVARAPAAASAGGRRGGGRVARAGGAGGAALPLRPALAAHVGHSHCGPLAAD